MRAAIRAAISPLKVSYSTRNASHCKDPFIVLRCDQHVLRASIHNILCAPQSPICQVRSASRFTPGDEWGSSIGGTGGSGSDTTFLCPKCGEPCVSGSSVVGGTRFARCSKCNHFFVILQEGEQTKGPTTTEGIPPRWFRKPPSPKKIYDHLSQFVIGQDFAKKVMSVAVYNHYKRIYHNTTELSLSQNDNHRKIEHSPSPSPVHTKIETLPDKQKDGSADEGSQTYLNKSNILMFGPTGTGKTLMAQCVANFLDLPFAICDCTSLTQAGYVGDDVDSVIARLVQSADNDASRAQHGIVFLDEVDKIGVVPGIHQLRDVGGEGVQQAFLKMLEGTKIVVTDRSMRKFRADVTAVDTSNILFIASGAFVGLEKIVERRTREQYLGFGSRVPSDKSFSRREATNMAIGSVEPLQDRIAASREKDELLRVVESRDLIEFGLIPEFVGRLPVNVPFHSLSSDMLVRILTEPKDSLLAQYETLFKMDGVELDVTKEALEKIASMALEKETGARGLRSIMEKILLDAMFDIPGSNICKVTVNEASLSEQGGGVQYEYSGQKTDNNQVYMLNNDQCSAPIPG